MSNLKTDRYRIDPGETVQLDSLSTDETGSIDKSDHKSVLKPLLKTLHDFQKRLYAESEQSLLVVFNGMDTSGKDSTVKHLFRSVNPQGLDYHNFQEPTEEERSHDFLWRIHRSVPSHGMIGIFNRSHYEDFTVARIKDFITPEESKRRLEHIRNFEKLLVDEGTRVVKFFLHISKSFQKKRLQKRLNKPNKHWKFDPEDLEDRKRWNDYWSVWEEALEGGSTEYSPWYVIPSDERWYRDIVVTKVLVDVLEEMDPQYPDLDFDPSNVEID
jgi:PPK2 family polyphosphate:nucleotide phosphotransferase